MNVCGGHERSITMAGLRKALPDYIELVPGPGCPVCVCPEEDVFEAIQLALYEDIILVAFGDMLRVPVNVPKAKARTLEQAKAQGADIRPIASPTEAVSIAEANPDKAVVFFAAGFETTTAPVAAMLVEGVPENLSVLLSGRLTWPAVAMLLDSGTPGFDALIAPGHVATIMGPEEWGFVVDKHNIPAAVAGFQPESLLAAMYSVLRQLNDKRYFLDNCYQQLVKPGGNKSAQAHLNKAMNVYDANWRGVGIIPASGYKLDKTYSKHEPTVNTMPEPCILLTRMMPVNVRGRCRRAVTVRRSYWEKFIPMNVSCLEKHASQEILLVRVWFQMKAPAGYGGRAVCERLPVLNRKRQVSHM